MPNTEEITLHSAGPIPGIPGGSYGPGRYLIDWDARTVTPITDDTQTTAPTAAETIEEI